MYSVFVRLCREMESVLRGVGLDGWDAIVAQGYSIKITKDSIDWYRNGKSHSIRDIHAQVYPNCRRWCRNGVFHRDGGPAVIYTDGLSWYQNGVIHRKDGPAIIDRRFDKCDYYYINGERYREDGPAVIDGDVNKLEWYQRGELHRKDGPARMVGSG